MSFLLSESNRSLNYSQCRRSSGTSTYNWTGFHIGANAGYGFNERNDDTLDNTVISSPFSCGPACGVLGFVSIAAPNLKAHGFLGGGQIGYDYQFAKSGLVGLEADIQYSEIHDSAEAAGTSLQQRLKWFGTVRARLGVLPIDRLLLYMTAGLVYGQTHNKVTIESLPQDFSASNSSLNAGGTVGGGLEWALGSHVSVKTEYLYYTLGSDKVDIAITSGFIGGAVQTTAHFETRGHIVRTGLNYKF